MVVTVMTGLESYAGLCTGPQQSLQDSSVQRDWLEECWQALQKEVYLHTDLKTVGG